MSKIRSRSCQMSDEWIKATGGAAASQKWHLWRWSYGLEHASSSALTRSSESHSLLVNPEQNHTHTVCRCFCFPVLQTKQIVKLKNGTNTCSYLKYLKYWCKMHVLNDRFILEKINILILMEKQLYILLLKPQWWCFMTNPQHMTYISNPGTQSSP